MIHGPLGDREDLSEAAAGNPLVAAFERALSLVNNVLTFVAALALIAACAILSYSVLGRALFHAANYWQDEAAVFLLVGTTFLTSAYVQGQRGHIGIEAFVGLLSPTANRIRLRLVEIRHDHQPLRLHEAAQLIEFSADAGEIVDRPEMFSSDSHAIFTSRASIFLPRNSGVRPTMRPLIKTAMMMKI